MQMTAFERVEGVSDGDNLLALYGFVAGVVHASSLGCGNTCRGTLPSSLGDLEHLEVLNVEGSGLSAGSEENSVKEYLPWWLEFDMYVCHAPVFQLQSILAGQPA